VVIYDCGKYEYYSHFSIRLRKSKTQKQKEGKIMCENYCLDLDSMPKVLQTLDGVTLCGLSYRRPENKPTAKHARIWANVGALSPLIKTR